MSAQLGQPGSSKKDEKPTLAGVNVKTRKRNVAVPLDPAGFAESVLLLFAEHCNHVEDITDKLAAAGKALDTTKLDFSRYGVTLFEIYFAGARMGVGMQLADDVKRKLDWNILACEPEVDQILPFIKAFHALVRRRPFLVQRLEEVLTKLLTSLEFFEDAGRQKIALVTVLVFTEKLGVLPERVFESMFNDRLVGKGTVLQVITYIFRSYIHLRGTDELIGLLTKARVVHRILEFFPPGQQTPEAFEAHFLKEGLQTLVNWQSKQVQENRVEQLYTALMDCFRADEDIETCLECVSEYKHACPPEDVVRVIWTVLIKSINFAGKNHMQMHQLIVKSLNEYKPLLVEYVTCAKLELALLNSVQVSCYEDSKLLKMFVDIVKHMYELDLLGEEVILFWFKKGSCSRGRNVFLMDIQSFVKWLEEAEEDDDEE